MRSHTWKEWKFRQVLSYTFQAMRMVTKAFNATSRLCQALHNIIYLQQSTQSEPKWILRCPILSLRAKLAFSFSSLFFCCAAMKICLLGCTKSRKNGNEREKEVKKKRLSLFSSVYLQYTFHFVLLNDIFVHHVVLRQCEDNAGKAKIEMKESRFLLMCDQVSLTFIDYVWHYWVANSSNPSWCVGEF